MGRVKEAAVSWPFSLSSTENHFVTNQEQTSFDFSSLPARFLATNGPVSSTFEQTKIPFIELPLSRGFYKGPSLYTSQPSPPFSTLSPDTSSITPPTTPLNSIPSSPTLIALPVSSTNENGTNASLTRKEKLEKYRQKRTKRNYNRPTLFKERSERAQARERDEHGHFVSKKLAVGLEEACQLESVKRESAILQHRLNEVEQKLERQQQLNDQLINENRILWSSLPANDVFSTIRSNSPFVDAFKEKVDLGNVELNWTDSPFFEEIRMDEEFENRWIPDSNPPGSFS